MCPPEFSRTNCLTKITIQKRESVVPLVKMLEVFKKMTVWGICLLTKSDGVHYTMFVGEGDTDGALRKRCESSNRKIFLARFFTALRPQRSELLYYFGGFKKMNQASNEKKEATTDALYAVEFTNEKATPQKLIVVFHLDGSAKFEGTETLCPTFSNVEGTASPYFRTNKALAEAFGLTSATTYTAKNATADDKKRMNAHNELHGSKKSAPSVIWYKKDYATADAYTLDLLALLKEWEAGKNEDGKDELRLEAFNAVATAKTATKPLEAVAKLRKDCEERENARKAREALTATTSSLVEKLNGATAEDKAEELRNLFTALGITAEEFATLTAKKAN